MEDNYPEIKVAVSCLNQISNSKAVSFYLNFSNVTRIVFPRHMAIEEITKIASCYPNIEFEYFIFSNKCLYDDGYCRSVHAFTPICKDLFYNEFYSTSNKSISDKLFKELNRTADEYRNWSKSLLSSQIKGCCTPNFACSACSLVKSNKYKNIISVKISIRGHSIEERKRQVDMAKKLIDASKKGSKKEIQSMLCKLFGKEDICSSENHCMMK